MSERKDLVSAEVEKLIAAVKGSRNAARDRRLLLLMFLQLKVLMRMVKMLIVKQLTMSLFPL